MDLESTPFDMSFEVGKTTATAARRLLGIESWQPQRPHQARIFPKNRTWHYRCIPRGYDALRLFLALLLLTAAGLKAHQLATGPLLGPGLLESRWFLVAVVEFELFFGLWLISGLFSFATWCAAIACFASFACIATWKMLSGESSCGCFCRVQVSPWYSAALESWPSLPCFDVARLARSVVGPPRMPLPCRKLAACLYCGSSWGLQRQWR